jgi:GAF domain-containing protein
MVDGIDPSASARSVGELRRADLASGELESSLRAVAEATAAVFGADGGGIMLLDDQQALHYVGATTGRAAALEAAQTETGEGPCVDSLMHGDVVSTNDLPADDRWPNLRGQMEGIGVRAVLGIPLRLQLVPIGSLNVYRGEPWEWGPDDVAAISAHGQIVEEVLAGAMLAQRQHTLVTQLRDALQHRILIERAVGVVVASRQLDPVHAFNELRSLARARRIRVAELADEVVAARSFPPGPT